MKENPETKKRKKKYNLRLKSKLNLLLLFGKDKKLSKNNYLIKYYLIIRFKV
jgi:hypothetical protein